ncbi:hypothetical protein CA13_30130 [Planctomycetes bacterium CA13]|uniref:Uncharacterized protein n=1 Tax=Novipirellula herctigrandis TaxID=2527986 RepID=A0A5C5Z309_9BACT|nr:hypothetical protein CA13_30130 [Planctomycetes bacterium CA13]
MIVSEAQKMNMKMKRIVYRLTVCLFFPRDGKSGHLESRRFLHVFLKNRRHAGTPGIQKQILALPQTVCGRDAVQDRAVCRC